jgi:zinc/manganese transport system substrate-binding protein
VGDRIDVYVATHAQQDPHHIEARPSLIAAVRQADMLVCTGAELEAGWLPILLRDSGNARIQPGTAGYFEAAEWVSMLDVPEHLDRSDGDVHADGNPHVHLDPRNIPLIGRALSASLQEVYPQHAAGIAEREQAFLKAWAGALSRWEKAAAPLAGRAVVVQHRNWRYFTQWAGINIAHALEPKPGVPPSARHLAEVLAGVKREPVAFIMIADYEDPRGARWLSQRTGLDVKVLPFTVGAEGTQSLFQLFDVLIARLDARGTSLDH